MKTRSIAAGVGIDGFLAPILNLDLHVAFQLEEDKCFGANQTAALGASSPWANSAALGTAIAGGLAHAGCGSTDHSKATVSSFHLGGALTWSF